MKDPMRILLAVLFTALATIVMAEDKADIFHGENVFHYTVENGTELFVHSDTVKTGLVIFCDKPESIRALIALNEPFDIKREKPAITVKTSDGEQGYETSARVLADGRKFLLVDPDNARMVHFKSTRFIDDIAGESEVTIDLKLVEAGMNESYDFSEYPTGVSKVSAECGYQPK